MVSGEASESDEEEVNTDEIHQLPPLKGTVKPAYMVTSIKGSPVLSSHLFWVP